VAPEVSREEIFYRRATSTDVIVGTVNVDEKLAGENSTTGE
jgi:hypothetical protein